MTSTKAIVKILAVMLSFVLASVTSAQQKAQWVPGQFGLNAGVIPDPGFTYENFALNYSASQLNDSSGSKLPNISGTYSFWVDENILMFVPKHKVLGRYFAPYISLNVANGSLVADLANDSNLSANGGAPGFADTFVQPVNIGWHFSRADANVGYAFTAPTGRFVPGASDNVGSGYWGNDITSGITGYLTKNKGTSVNLFNAWEIHSQKKDTNLTPGQAFTVEWGLGQVLPLNKKMRNLAQFGLVGCDQFQVSANGGTIGAIPARALPYYSSHGIGAQANYIQTVHGLSLLQVLQRVQRESLRRWPFFCFRRRLDAEDTQSSAGQAVKMV